MDTTVWGIILVIVILLIVIHIMSAVIKRYRIKRSIRKKMIAFIKTEQIIDFPIYTEKMISQVNHIKQIPWQDINLSKIVMEIKNRSIKSGYFGKEKEFPKIRLLMMDEEYPEWLKLHHYEDSENCRNEYMEGLSDDEAFRLLQKNGRDKDIEILGLPLSIQHGGNQTKTTEFKIPNNFVETLKEYLNDVYQGCQVFVPGYVMEENGFTTCVTQFRHLAKSYFDDGKKIILGKWDEQKHTRDDIYNLFIPFAVQKKYASAILDVQEIEKSYFYNMSFLPFEYIRAQQKGRMKNLDFSIVENNLIRIFQGPMWDVEMADFAVEPKYAIGLCEKMNMIQRKQTNRKEDIS